MYWKNQLVSTFGTIFCNTAVPALPISGEFKHDIVCQLIQVQVHPSRFTLELHTVGIFSIKRRPRLNAGSKMPIFK